MVVSTATTAAAIVAIGVGLAVTWIVGVRGSGGGGGASGITALTSVFGVDAEILRVSARATKSGWETVTGLLSTWLGWAELVAGGLGAACFLKYISYYSTVS